MPHRRWRDGRARMIRTLADEQPYGLLANIQSVSDLIDAFASVRFFNSKPTAILQNDILRPVAVYMVRDSVTQKPNALIRFKSLTGKYPYATNGVVSVLGCLFTFSLANTCPTVHTAVCVHQVINFDVTTSNGNAERLAADVAAEIIGEKTHGNNLEFFGALTTRLEYFRRAQLHMRCTVPNQTSRLPFCIEPYKKPIFSKPEDLFMAFTRHETLVFCHKISMETILKSYDLECNELNESPLRELCI